MAAPRKSAALAHLAPNLIEIKNEDGSTMQVPTNIEENKILNMILAAKVRHFMQEALKKYMEDGGTPSAKDLKDIAEAFNKIAEGSNTIYTTGPDDVLGQQAKRPKSVEPAEEIKFDALIGANSSSQKPS